MSTTTTNKHNNNVQQCEQLKSNNDSIFEPDHKRSCFVGGIPIDMDEASLKETLSKKCPELEIDRVDLIMAKKGKKKKKTNKGFGFVTFKTPEDQNKFINQVIYIGPKMIDIRKAKKMNEQRKIQEDDLQKRVFIRGFKNDITDQKLAYFLNKNCIPFRRCYIVRDFNKNKTKGIGIIDFYTEKDASKFVEKKELNIFDSCVQVEHFSLEIKLKKNSEEKNESQRATSSNNVSHDGGNDRSHLRVPNTNFEAQYDVRGPFNFQNSLQKTKDNGKLSRKNINPKNLNNGHHPQEADDDQQRWVFLEPSTEKNLNEAPMNYHLRRTIIKWGYRFFLES